MYRGGPPMIATFFHERDQINLQSKLRFEPNMIARGY